MDEYGGEMTARGSSRDRGNTARRSEKAQGMGRLPPPCAFAFAAKCRNYSSELKFSVKTDAARGGTRPEISSMRVFALWFNLEKLNIVPKIVKILAF